MNEEKLESEMSELGTARYLSRLSKYRANKLETCTPAGQRVLEKSTQLLSEGIKLWVAQASRAPGRMHRVLPYLEKLPFDVAAMITCRSVIDGITSSRTITSLAVTLGRLIEDESKFRWLAKNHKGFWRLMMKNLSKQPSDQTKIKHIARSAKYQNIVLPKWSPKDRTAVGLVLIELMRQRTGIIDVINRSNALGKEIVLVRGTDEFLAWLEKSHEAATLLAPVYMPMIVTPRKWDSVWTGGYFGVSFGRKPMVKVHSKKYLNTIDNLEMPEVYQAVNNIQETAWTVNNRVAEVLRHCWEHDIAVGDLPSRSGAPIPPKPVDIDTNMDARRAWRKSAAKIHCDNEADRSKRVAVSKTLWLADKFNDKSIYFPQELDFRGRVYPKPIFLNNQGADWQRSLLTFSKGKPVDDNAMSWLAVHGANSWGMDKVDFKSRVAWISDNHNMILAAGRDPLANMSWTEADKPWSFLAFAMEWARVHDNPGTSSGLPIHLDGSNNGLQIFSLLLKDPIGALATNCVQTDTPQDIYQIVADRVKEKLAAIGDPLAQTWLAFGIDRKTTKRVVMCLPYGLTQYSARGYVDEWYREKSKSTSNAPFGKMDSFQPVLFLSGLIWDAISETVVAARECMDWLKQVAAIHIDAGVPIRWTAPTGFLVEQGYKKSSKIMVKTSIGHTIRQHRMIVDGTELSKKRNVNGISPNFVHSLDAALLMRTVNMANANGITDISCIHDSFGVCPADAGNISTIIRECAVDMFDKPLLHGVHSEMSKYLPKGISLPDPPKQGSLDISQLRNADYFFA